MAKKIKEAVGGALVGIANGLFGGGGGTIAVPLLLASGKRASEAHATAIAIILPASIVSGAVYLVRGIVPIPSLVPVLLGAAAGGFCGAKLLGLFSERIISLLFAILLIASGLRMLF